MMVFGYDGTYQAMAALGPGLFMSRSTKMASAWWTKPEERGGQFQVVVTGRF